MKLNQTRTLVKRMKAKQFMQKKFKSGELSLKYGGGKGMSEWGIMSADD